MAKLKIKDTEITVIQVNDEDYICITDMIKEKEGEFFVTDWLRNRNTLEYLGIWEQKQVDTEAPMPIKTLPLSLLCG